MLVSCDDSDGFSVDIRGTLYAAHEAVNSFLLLHTLFEDEANVWYHSQHKAFSEAVMSALRSCIFIVCYDTGADRSVKDLTIAELMKSRAEGLAIEPIYMQAKTDLIRMSGILQLSSDHNIVGRTRVSVLSK